MIYSLKQLKISLDYIRFGYNSDILFYHFPWGREDASITFYSVNHKRYFYSFKEYKLFIQEHEKKLKVEGLKYSKIRGIDIEDLICQWMSAYYRRGCFLVLSNIDPSFKPREFWDQVPKHYADSFTRDVCVLICKDLTQLKNIGDSININFARALGFVDGKLVYDNQDWN